MPAPALVLWDIDRTLLNAGGISRELYVRAFERVVGRPLDIEVDLTGRTERASVTETLRRSGISDVTPLLATFYAEMALAAAALRAEMRRRGRALPAARETLADLAADGVVQTVVTGNVRPVAEIKLAVFGFTQHLDLDLGGYGDVSADRADLVRRAIGRAESAHATTFDPARVIVVGDTVHDVRGALDVGVRAVGVASGTTSVAELTAAGASAVLSGLTDLAAVRAALFGPQAPAAGAPAPVSVRPGG
ncbi:HAD family hydrolase [Candidatus Frankia nodulisporulans]|uniref:HAD family hydrolase n=1 Tax=Candidatus Frankia nodulisporulans TaxID=2060052 RepID=UPI0013D8D28C|nr:haloacid dehalogenase-like hydrolase [Candidatus Frankia nodulisporulans]